MTTGNSRRVSLQNKTKDLYTTSDVKKVREALLLEQNNLDSVTGLEIPQKQAVLDHCHNSQYVRAVLHRQVNASLGKIENLWIRYLKHWYPYDLSTFLRQCADYIEKEPDKRFYHPGWIKKVNASFNKLSAKEQDRVLTALGSVKGSNSTQRKELFKRKLLTKSFSFDTIKSFIEGEE